MKNSTGYLWKLGLFVIIGFVIFVATIFIVGKNKNLFGSTFHVQSQFKNVSGLKVGNHVRFSGINIGTVTDIEFESDTAVIVHLTIEEKVHPYIKSDALASIGSDGLMGDKVLTISHGILSREMVKDHGFILSTQAIEMEDLMKNLKRSLDNAEIITSQIAQFSSKMNDENGILSKLLTSRTLANNLDQTALNLQTTSQEFALFSHKMNNNNGVLSKLVNDEKLGQSIDSTFFHIEDATRKLNEIEEAAKHSFLIRGYFNKKEKAELKRLKKLNETD